MISFIIIFISTIVLVTATSTEPNFKTYREYANYKRQLMTTTPVRLEPYLQQTADGSYTDDHLVNCFRGVVTRQGVQYMAIIRYGSCASKGGFDICLKMSDDKWHYDLDDKYEILDMIVNKNQTMAKIFVESRFEEGRYGLNLGIVPQGWFRFEIIDWF